jgi:hypothetical protein
MHAPHACQPTIQHTLTFLGTKKHCKQKCLELLPIHVIARVDWVNSFCFFKKEYYNFKKNFYYLSGNKYENMTPDD